MSLPTSIRVGYRDYDVVKLDPRVAEANNVHGQHTKFLCLIEVRQDTKPAEQADTLIHEVLHAAWSVAEVQAKDGEERIVTALAHQLASIIRDNPALVTYLTETLRP